MDSKAEPAVHMAYVNEPVNIVSTQAVSILIQVGKFSERKQIETPYFRTIKHFDFHTNFSLMISTQTDPKFTGIICDGIELNLFNDSSIDIG